MALIKCPECGKEVSSAAKACPNCGCPMEDMVKLIETEELHQRTKNIDYEIDGDSSHCKACATCGSIHWNPNAEGFRGGYCIECRGKKLYDNLIKIDYPTATFRQRIGSLPSGTIIDNSINKAKGIAKYQELCNQYFQRIYDVERELFEAYVKDWDSLDKESFTYKLNMENLYSHGKGEAHTQIDEGVRAKVQPSIVIHNPKCPNCGSPNVQKISDMTKGISFALWGVFSNNFGKQYQCATCRYKW